MSKTAHRLYMREIENIPPMTKQAERAYFIAWKDKGMEAARTKIYRANLRFVTKVANNYRSCGLPIIDLISEGNLALDRAMKEFDYNYDVKLISWAVWKIRQAILKLLAEQGHMVSVTGTEMTNKSKVDKAINRLHQKLQREPTLNELEIETGFPTEKITHILLTLGYDSFVSLSKPIGINKDKLMMEDTIADDKMDKPDDIDDPRAEVAKLLKEANLNEKSMNVITSYFGIDDKGERTLEEIGFDYNQTRERMRQIKEKAMKALEDLVERKKNPVLREVLYA